MSTIYISFVCLFVSLSTSLFAYYLSSICWCAFLSIFHLLVCFSTCASTIYHPLIYVPGLPSVCLYSWLRNYYLSFMSLYVCLPILLVFCSLSIFYLHACLSVYPSYYAANIYHPLVCVHSRLFVCLSNCICSNNLSSISLCV